MSDKLTVGKITFASPRVSIKSRGVKLLKKADIRPDDTAQRCHEIGLLRILAVKYPRIVRELTQEKSFDTGSDSP